MYKVYVAGVNGAGRGDWQETQNAVTTQGLGRFARTPITHTYVHTDTQTHSADKEAMELLVKWCVCVCVGCRVSRPQ